MLRAVVLRLDGDLGVIDMAAPADLASEGVWTELETKLRPFIARRLSARVDVDDVVQEVFVRMQRGLPALRDEQRFGPWVYQVARSAIVDHQRASARHPVATGSQPSEPEAFTDDDDDDEVARQVAAYAALLVALLPSPYREALTLTELEGLSQKDAAHMIGLSISGMKSRVQRGRHKLRAILDDCCDIALDARRRVVGCQPRADGALPDCCCK